jgi:hypothetical protein
MDRITHQSLRQRGYGSTSSLRNDPLKHTQKHERRREESNQGTKLPGTGGLSGQVGRTVRKGRADCPAGNHGLSAPVPRTVRPRVADRPLNPTEPPVVNPEKTDRPRGARGLSARHPWTVRPAHADRPKPRPTKTQSHDRPKAKRSKNTKNTRRTADRGPSATGTRTVRPLRIERKTARPRRSTPPIHHRISQTVEAVETRVWGHEKRQPRMIYPKNFAS